MRTIAQRYQEAINTIVSRVVGDVRERARFELEAERIARTYSTGGHAPRRPGQRLPTNRSAPISTPRPQELRVSRT